MRQFRTLRKVFVQQRGPYFAATTAAAAALLAATWEHSVSADGAKDSTTSHGVESKAAPASSPREATLIPTDKLSCKTHTSAPRTPVVLVSCGSFNPPTVMHMRMVHLAGNELMKRGYDVWGAYLSPVADAYGKASLAPAIDRVAMCRLAAEDESMIYNLVCGGAEGQLVQASCRCANPAPSITMVYDWEASQPGYTRTLAVLRRVEAELRGWLSEPTQSSVPEVTPAPGCTPVIIESCEQRGLGEGPGSSVSPAAQLRPRTIPEVQKVNPPSTQSETEPKFVRAMLLCGGDVLASMAVPGVWRDPDVILRDHGVVCVAREGTDLEQLLSRPGSVLYDYRERIIIVYDKVGNSISSSKVRQELAAGRPVLYLVPPRVLSYIYDRGLYGTTRK